jgi:hypothetical protein
MKKLFASFVLCIAAAAGAYAQAQGSSVTMRPLSVPDRASPDDVQAYSHSLTGKVSAVDAAGKTIVVNWADGTHSKYFINNKTRLKADGGTALASRKGLTLADYQPGETVTVTLRNSDRQVLEIRLRRAKD